MLDFRRYFLLTLFFSSLIPSRGEAKSLCSRYEFEKLTANTLDKSLEEMSGLVIYSKGKLIHIQDSGNDPLLIFTERDGKVIESISYAPENIDAEELQKGPCPQKNGVCFYVFDTGDNFKWRTERTIWIIDEESLRSPSKKMESLRFIFPNKERIDSEAAVVVGKTIYIFSKEKKHARVFALDMTSNPKEILEARLIDDLPYTMITGASVSSDGERILLLNWQGVRELALKGEGKKEASSFYPFRQFIKIKKLAQQEAISFDEDQRSFLYSSEKKKFSDDEWGIMRAKCVP